MRHDEPMHFDSILPIEVTLTLDTASYIIREASGAVTKKYRTMVLDGLSNIRDNQQGGGAIADAPSYLVSQCLFQLMPDGNRIPVAAHTFESWPGKIFDAIFERVKLISRIDQPKTIKDIDAQIEKLQLLRKDLERDSLGKH